MTAHTQTELLVLALAQVERRKRTFATVAEVAVAAWKLDRRRWGLRGFESEYVDSNKVSCGLCHRKGPIRQGLIERPWPGVAVLQLTRAGKELAERLGTEERRHAS